MEVIGDDDRLTPPPSPQNAFFSVSSSQSSSLSFSGPKILLSIGARPRDNVGFHGPSQEVQRVQLFEVDTTRIPYLLVGGGGEFVPLHD